MNITSSYQVRIVNCSVNLIDTVRIYQEALSYLIGVVSENWDAVKSITTGALEQQRYIEKLVHGNKNREAKYQELRRIKKESHLNQSEKDIPEKDGKITTASAAALMPALTCPRPLPRATISALCGTLNPTISRVTNEKCRHIPRRSPIYSRKA